MPRPYPEAIHVLGVPIDLGAGRRGVAAVAVQMLSACGERFVQVEAVDAVPGVVASVDFEWQIVFDAQLYTTG